MVLISHKYKFIFIKNLKVAGTSVEAFFQRYCMENEDEYIIKEQTPMIVTQYGIVGMRGNKINGKKYFNHMPIKSIHKLHPIYFEKYYKFCVVRNPFDQVVSAYHFFMVRKKLSFEQFVNNLAKKNPNGYDWDRYCINNKPVMNFYIRFENLEADIKKVCEILKIKNYNLNSLPRFKEKHKDPRNYRNYYNENTKKIVEKIFKKQLDFFGYSY